MKHKKIFIVSFDGIEAWLFVRFPNVRGNSNPIWVANCLNEDFGHDLSKHSNIPTVYQGPFDETKIKNIVGSLYDDKVFNDIYAHTKHERYINVLIFELEVKCEAKNI